MYVISAHHRHRQTDRRTDAKRWHDRSIALAWSGKKGHKLEAYFFGPPCTFSKVSTTQAANTPWFRHHLQIWFIVRPKTVSLE